MKQAYLLLYNSLCGAGWAFCAFSALAQLRSGGTAQALYSEIGSTLTVVQTAMCLEVLHSILGLVPSPVFTVVLQVSSRIFILWGHLYWVTQCQRHWSLFLMVISWSITETVRYTFYFLALLGKVPFPIFWLRYSLFMFLYPTGITGELIQTVVGMGAHWHTANPLWYRLSVLMLIFYIPGSPGMIGNMWANRKRSLKKRAAESKPVEEEGLVWPKDKKGERSSTGTNQAIIAAAARAGPDGEVASKKVLAEKKWRFKYDKHLIEHVKMSLQSESACIAMARAGLAAAHDTFQFRRGDKEMSVKDAMSHFTTEMFETAGYKGEAKRPSNPKLEIMYGGPTAGKCYSNFKNHRKNLISGKVLSDQLDAWAEYGTIEPDCAEALKLVLKNENEWLNLSEMYFVLLGAGSAMGPLKFLLKYGANVIAVAQPRTLRRILEEAKNTPGQIFFPVKKGTAWAGKVAAGGFRSLEPYMGCNLMTQAPEIALWLKTVVPGKRLVIGNYTYLDAAKHVQIAVACDGIIESLCHARKDTAVAFLGTPTDVHVVSKDAAESASQAYKKASPWFKLWERVGAIKENKAITASEGLIFQDAIVNAQGPNYILAKRLQHWRAVVARADGHTASSNVAPSAATASVTSNASFAAAYNGLHMFKPMEVMYEELALTAMSALLIYDVCCKESAAQASTKLPNPLCLFQRTSFHGGTVRCPYTIATIGVPSAVKYYFTTFWLPISGSLFLHLASARYVIFGTVPGILSEIKLPSLITWS